MKYLLFRYVYYYNDKRAGYKQLKLVAEYRTKGELINGIRSYVSIGKARRKDMEVIREHNKRYYWKVAL